MNARNLMKKYFTLVTIVALVIVATTIGDAETNKLFDLRVSDIEKAKAIIKENPNAVKERDNKGVTPLHAVAMILSTTYDAHGKGTRNDPSPLAMLLIENGADVNARDNKGVTPLHYAIMKGNTNLANLLIDKGADVNAVIDKEPDFAGTTALHFAAANGYMSILNQLLSKGADAKKRDAKGQTPLHIAAQFGEKEAAELLMKKFPEIVNERDNKGQTALSISTQSQNDSLVEILRQHGAK